MNNMDTSLKTKSDSLKPFLTLAIAVTCRTDKGREVPISTILLK